MVNFNWLIYFYAVRVSRYECDKTIVTPFVACVIIGVVLIYSLLCSNSIVNSTMNFTSKFDTQILTVAFLGIDLEERMKYKIK